LLKAKKKLMDSSHYHLDLSDKTIAIVDDDIASIRYFEVLLKTTGAEVLTFLNGTDLVNFIIEGGKNVDLIMLDYLIPYINGIDCVREVRKANKNMPLIIVTAYYTRESREEAFLAGCNEYILKPVIPEKVLSLLERYLVQKEHAPSTL